jgi:hypothetical protein
LYRRWVALANRAATVPTSVWLVSYGRLPSQCLPHLQRGQFSSGSSSDKVPQLRQGTKYQAWDYCMHFRYFSRKRFLNSIGLVSISRHRPQFIPHQMPQQHSWIQIKEPLPRPDPTQNTDETRIP